jgi:hypothetical protein
MSDRKRKFMYLVIDLLNQGIKPTPKLLNERLGRTYRQQLDTWECICRVKLMEIFGYTLQSNGRWEIDG